MFKNIWANMTMMRRDIKDIKTIQMEPVEKYNIKNESTLKGI